MEQKIKNNKTVSINAIFYDKMKFYAAETGIKLNYIINIALFDCFEKIETSEDFVIWYMQNNKKYAEFSKNS